MVSPLPISSTVIHLFIFIHLFKYLLFRRDQERPMEKVTSWMFLKFCQKYLLKLPDSQSWLESPLQFRCSQSFFQVLSCLAVTRFPSLAYLFPSHLLPTQSFSCAALLIPALRHFWWNVGGLRIAWRILYGKELKNHLIYKGHFLFSTISIFMSC